MRSSPLEPSVCQRAIYNLICNFLTSAHLLKSGEALATAVLLDFIFHYTVLRRYCCGGWSVSLPFYKYQVSPAVKNLPVPASKKGPITESFTTKEELKSAAPRTLTDAHISITYFKKPQSGFHPFYSITGPACYGPNQSGKS